MNSGVAKQIRKTYPQVYDEYIDYCRNTKPQLGFVQCVPIKSNQTICNLFAQDKYGYDGNQYTSLDAFKKCMLRLNVLAKGMTVAMPYKIGCVRGGADWNDVLNIIQTTLTLCDVELWRLDKG